MHKSDPTITSIDFTKQIRDISISKEVFAQIKLLSLGYEIEVKEDQIIPIQIISTILENDELFTKVSKEFDDNINETNIDHYLTNLKLIYQISSNHTVFNYNNIFNYIASHFYSIDQKKISELPLEIILLIISNPNLKIESEDSLFDFIIQIFNEKENKQPDVDDISIISFYEEIMFDHLSESKFNEFLDKFSGHEMTDKLFQKLSKCFYVNMKNSSSGEFDNNRYVNKVHKFDFDGNQSYAFEGIINYLTKKSGGNVSDNGTVKVTSSSTNESQLARNSVDFQENSNYFQSNRQKNDWLMFDFINSKVHPTHYSIRTRNDFNCHHPKNWVIEGSNTGSDIESEWTVLDSRQNDGYLNNMKVTHTYSIQNDKKEKEYFRYIRIRQTGVGTSNDYYLTLSCLEYFGNLIEKE